jgi:hypothetical protein
MRIKKYLIIIFFILNFIFLLKGEYIPDPVLLNGRGAVGSDWETMHNGQSTKSFCNSIKK